MILPTVSLAVGQIAVYMRLLRSDMIATLQEDFITVARAKGLPTSQVLWRYALRPSSITLLTVAGPNVGTPIGGSAVSAGIFSVPGMGMLIYVSILERKYIALQSSVARLAVRSHESSVGHGWASTCRSRWSSYPLHKKIL